MHHAFIFKLDYYMVNCSLHQHALIHPTEL